MAFGSIFVREKDTGETTVRILKEPYKRVRHIAIFTDEDEAITTAKRLNYSVYYPLGLTKDEMKTLYDENRSKYGVEETNGEYHLIERLVY